MNYGGYKWYSKDDIASWPDNHKRCRGCDAILPFAEFHRQKQTLFGLNNYCKLCRHPRSVSDYAKKPIEQLIYERAKSRARKHGVPFDIDVEDIDVPSLCPALSIPLERSDTITDNTPSLDRIDPAKGYVRGNIAVISNKANRIKSNAEAYEIESVALWLRSVI
jgi:uncharacterized protein (DUF3084 family)